MSDDKTPAHTPGKLRLDDYAREAILSVEEGRPVASTCYGPGPVGRANAARVVACWNACEGIADPDAFVKAAMRFDALDCCTGYSFPEPEWPAFWAALEELREAIERHRKAATTTQETDP